MAAACPAPRPPMPGVSTSTSPCVRIALGTAISTRSTPRSLPGFPASVTHVARSSIVDLLGDLLAVDAPSHHGGGLVGVADERDRGGREVVVDRARVAPSSPFTSELFPCLNSPTTHTTVAGRRRRAPAALARSARSVRPSCCRTPTSCGTAASMPVGGAGAVWCGGLWRGGHGRLRITGRRTCCWSTYRSRRPTGSGW